MKNILLLILLPFLALSPFDTTTNAPDKGLIAYYSFNKCDARDDSGNGNDGQLFGDIGCYCGVEGDGLLFDGSRDYIEFQGAINKYFTTSDFTISFYFKTNQYSLFKQSMLGKRETCEEYNMFDIQLDQHQKEIDTDIHETPIKDFAFLSPEYNTGAAWHHFALVKRGIRAYTYVNGQPQKVSRRCSGVDISNEAVLSFSNSPCVAEGMARRFNGILDELRIYSKALEDDDILQLYAKYPVEYAEVDCVSFQEKDIQDIYNANESTYLCAQY